jgi:phage terminase Nu1 subunit (DNA packaging protein)
MGKAREDALLNGRQCAESIGISKTTFINWKVPPSGTRGSEKLYALKDVLDVYRDKCRREMERELREEIKAELAESGDDMGGDPLKVKLELDKKRVRLTEAQAIHQEMKNEMMRHEVAPFAFITFVLGKTSNAIAGVMDAMPVELMRKLSLKPQEVEKVRAVASMAADSIASLGDEQWLEERFDEFLVETDQ